MRDETRDAILEDQQKDVHQEDDADDGDEDLDNAPCLPRVRHVDENGKDV